MASVRNLGYFPYCPPDENPYASSFFEWVGTAFRGDLKSAMAFYWRIKRIKITINAHFEKWDLYTEGGPTQLYSIDTSKEFFMKVANKEKENDIVCLGDFGLQWESETDGLSISTTGENMFNPLWINGSEYNIGFPFHIFYGDPQDPFGGITSLWFGYPLPDHPYWDEITNITGQEETLNINDQISLKTNVLKTFANLENSGAGYPYVAETTSWSFEIDEWWEYDPEDGGGPIYDSATGERIREDI